MLYLRLRLECTSGLNQIIVHVVTVVGLDPVGIVADVEGLTVFIDHQEANLAVLDELAGFIVHQGETDGYVAGAIQHN